MANQLAASFMTLALLSGCASAYTRNELAKDQKACALGDQHACQSVPYDLEAVEASRKSNTDTAVTIAAVAVLLPLIVLGAAAAAQQPDYVVVARCRGWAC
jgi:hypothetical protein